MNKWVYFSSKDFVPFITVEIFLSFKGGILVFARKRLSEYAFILAYE